MTPKNDTITRTDEASSLKKSQVLSIDSSPERDEENSLIQQKQIIAEPENESFFHDSKKIEKNFGATDGSGWFNFPQEKLLQKESLNYVSGGYNHHNDISSIAIEGQKYDSVPSRE